jgi:hypothetical protein
MIMKQVIERADDAKLTVEGQERFHQILLVP